MIDEKEYIRLKEKNRKLKAKVWNDYRYYSDELRMLKHQNRSLQNSIKLEQNKNRELFQHFSNKISQLQEQIRQVSYDTPSYTSNFSLSQNKKKKKDNFQWRFQELEEEGKALQLDTEKTFKKCRESSSLNFWLRDIPPPSTNYQFSYAPIVISPPQLTKSRQENYFMNDEDDLSSSSSKQNDLQISPIASSNDRHKKNHISKKKENYSSNSSTVSVKQDLNKYENDFDNMSESSNSSDNYDISSSQYIPKDNIDTKKEKGDVNDKNSKTTNKQKSDQKISTLQNSTQNQVDISQTSQNNRFPPPSLQITQNQQLNNNNKPSENNAKNTKLPSPIHIKTHIDDESDTDAAETFYQQEEQISQPIQNQKPKQQSEVQIIKPIVTNSNNAYANFMSQSNWDVGNDNEEISIDIEEVSDDKTKEQENVNKTKSNLLGGIQSDTNPIIDSSDQNNQSSFKQQPKPQEDNQPPQSTISTTDVKTPPKKTSSPGSLESKGDFDFEINFEDINSLNDDGNNNNNFW